jgi:hypothetical protein
MQIGDGAGDGPRNIVTPGTRQRVNISSAISQLTVHYRLDIPGGSSVYLFSQSRVVNPFGKEKVVNNPFLRQHVVADMVADYLSKLERFGQDTCDFELTQEARTVLEGDLLQVLYSPYGYRGDLVRVLSVDKSLTTTRVTVSLWSDLIFLYEPAALPVDTPITGPVTTIGPPSTPTGLGLASSTFLDNDGHVKVFLDANWDSNTEVTVIGYEVSFRRAGDSVWTLRNVNVGRTA